MDKREALIKCRDHWEWIAENSDRGTPDQIKGLYFQEHGIEEHPDSGCYCCEYNNQMGMSENCSHCPLAGYVWKRRFLACIHPSTDYMGWVRAVFNRDGEVANYYALEIADACKRALEDMEG